MMGHTLSGSCIRPGALVAKLACLLACRGLVEGLGPFRGWAQLSGELGLSGTPSGIRELRPPVGTSADIPSQTWRLGPPLLEFHPGSSRDSAPLASVGARPATGMSTGSATSSPASRDAIVPASHRSSSQSSPDSTPEGWCKPGVQLSAWNTAPPDISLRAVTTQAIRLEYGTAPSKVCCSYCQPGVELSAWNTAPQDIR